VIRECPRTRAIAKGKRSARPAKGTANFVHVSTQRAKRSVPLKKNAETPPEHNRTHFSEKILAGPASRCVIDTAAAIHEGRKDGAVLPDESVGPVRTFFSALFNRRSDAHCPSLPMCHACAVHCTCGRVPADAH